VLCWAAHKQDKVDRAIGSFLTLYPRVGDWDLVKETHFFARKLKNSYEKSVKANSKEVEGLGGDKLF